MVSINSRKASNISKLDSSLDPQSFRESRIKNRVSSIELRGTVNLPLSGTVFQWNDLKPGVYEKMQVTEKNHLQWPAQSM